MLAPSSRRRGRAGRRLAGLSLLAAAWLVSAGRVLGYALDMGRLACLLLVVSLGVTLLQDAAILRAEEDAEDEPPPPLEGLPYTVTFSGSASEGLLEFLKSVSELEQNIDQPPFSKAGLAQRVRQDKGTLVKALNSRGFYQPEISFEIGEGEPVPVTVTIDPGPQTTIGVFDITYESSEGSDKLQEPSLEDLGIMLGQPALSQDVLDSEAKIIQILGDNGFPDATIVKRRVTVDLDDNEMQVKLTVDPGPYLVFGPLAVDGLDRTDEEYVRRILEWPEGETFSNARLEQVRRKAVSTNLFSQVEISRNIDAIEDGDVEPVNLTLKERPPRTISLGVGFATDFSNTPFGFIGEAAWEHRNILGRGESLRLSVLAQPDEQSGTAFFNKPNWLINDQALQWRFAIANENQQAFNEFSIGSTIGVERVLTRTLTGFAGAGVKYLISDDLDSDDADSGKDQYILYTLPTRLTYDNRDDRLDATRGFLGVLAITPTLATITETVPYMQTSVTGTHYIKMFDDPNIVVAGRARVASLAGASVQQIPAGERLYAGGGGSVRGYEVDSLGPTDSDRDAIGGRSLLEFGVEARWRFWDDYGLVPFLDAGQVYEESYPNLTETIQYAAGLGLRYYSPIGPIRLDLASPINKRQQDRVIQFYISIGQAF